MSTVLPQTRSLGNKRLYEVLFGEVFVSGHSVLREDVRSYCLARLYRAGSHMDGALELLQEMGALHADGLQLKADDGMLCELMEHEVGFVVASRLILHLASKREIDCVFPPGSLSVGKVNGEVYIHLSRIPLEGLPAIRLMRDLDVIDDSEESPVLLTINGPLVSILKATVASSINLRRAAKSMTPEQLALLQEAQAKQGMLAEEFVLDFERNRLHGHMFLNLIERVSCYSVSSGYDIESFDELGSFLPDRFIEVKSYSGGEHFYLSEGELKAARNLGDQYYVYLVDMAEYSEPGYVPQMIRDPANELFRSDSLWSLVPISFRVDRIAE